MTTAAATLVQRATADGLCEFQASVPLGREYRVLPWTRRLVVLRHETGQLHEKEIINTPDGGWLPTECLLIAEGHA